MVIINIEEKIDNLLTIAKLIGWKVSNGCIEGNSRKSTIYGLNKDNWTIEFWVYIEDNELQNFNGKRWIKGNMDSSEERFRCTNIENFEKNLRRLMTWL